MRPPSLRRHGRLTWLRLTMQSRLARKKVELSSLRSHSPRERRIRSLSSAKWTSVAFRDASRMKMLLIRASRDLPLSVRRMKSSR
jgi:hypothetical protein